VLLLISFCFPVLLLIFEVHKKKFLKILLGNNELLCAAVN